MNDLSIIQKYLLCAVSEKGTLSDLSTEKQVCFVAAGLLELQLEGCLALEGKKAEVTGPLPENRQYLRPLYDFIAEKSPVKVETIVEAYRIAFTDKRMKELLAAVGGSLATLGLAEEGKAGLFGTKTAWVPAREAVRSVVEELRAELLEEGPVTEDAAALAVLLDKGKCLKPYFSQFEQKEMRRKLKSLTDSPEGRLVKAMVEHVETLMAALAAATVVATSM